MKMRTVISKEKGSLPYVVFVDNASGARNLLHFGFFCVLTLVLHDS
jgi:hypothetical protein